MCIHIHVFTFIQGTYLCSYIYIGQLSWANSCLYHVKSKTLCHPIIMTWFHNYGFIFVVETYNGNIFPTVAQINHPSVQYEWNSFWSFFRTSSYNIWMESVRRLLSHLPFIFCWFGKMKIFFPPLYSEQRASDHSQWFKSPPCGCETEQSGGNTAPFRGIPKITCWCYLTMMLCD